MKPITYLTDEIAFSDFCKFPRVVRWNVSQVDSQEGFLNWLFPKPKLWQVTVTYESESDKVAISDRVREEATKAGFFPFGGCNEYQPIEFATELNIRMLEQLNKTLELLQASRPLRFDDGDSWQIAECSVLNCIAMICTPLAAFKSEPSAD